MTQKSYAECIIVVEIFWPILEVIPDRYAIASTRLVLPQPPCPSKTTLRILSAYRWEGKEVVECDMPEYSKDNLQLCRDTLMEAVAETSEEFMEHHHS